MASTGMKTVCAAQAVMTICVRAVAVNPVDAIPGLAYRLIMPWLTFPAIIGGDVAGEVVEAGPGVTRLQPGDRVLGMADGLERSRNNAAEGAFQKDTVLMQNLVSPIPNELSFEQAAVLPLTLSTAATGLFQRDHLALPLPAIDAPDRQQTVLVWGGSTHVGSNGIQLARCAGYRVIATASPRNFGLRPLTRRRGSDRLPPSHRRRRDHQFAGRQPARRHARDRLRIPPGGPFNRIPSARRESTPTSCPPRSPPGHTGPRQTHSLLGTASNRSPGPSTSFAWESPRATSSSACDATSQATGRSSTATWLLRTRRLYKINMSRGVGPYSWLPLRLPPPAE